MWASARSSIRLGHGPLKAERRVRFPYALPLIDRQQLTAILRSKKLKKRKNLILLQSHPFSRLSGPSKPGNSLLVVSDFFGGLAFGDFTRSKNSNSHIIPFSYSQNF